MAIVLGRFIVKQKVCSRIKIINNLRRKHEMHEQLHGQDMQERL